MAHFDEQFLSGHNRQVLYVAASQTSGSLHTMTVLQEYQTDLLKDLDQGQVLSPEAVVELPHTTDLDLQATK